MCFTENYVIEHDFSTRPIRCVCASRRELYGQRKRSRWQSFADFVRKTQKIVWPCIFTDERAYIRRARRSRKRTNSVMSNTGCQILEKFFGRFATRWRLKKLFVENFKKTIGVAFEVVQRNWERKLASLVEWPNERWLETNGQCRT